MKKHFLIPLACGVLVATAATAQTRIVSGRVTDATGSNLPGVTVLERGTSNGTSTGADGSFTLSVQPGATLVLSSIGFETQNVVVGDRTSINATLKSSATELGEAVVVGYGTQAKADITGSIVQLGGKDVQNTPVPSFEQAIQGKAAGVFIENSSGKLGQGIKVRVRGATSVSGGNQPLYVVDGVPIISESQSGISAETNPIADLNANDIESISILKDAAASAIYGSRASNGVVLITTKRGREGATRFNLSYQTGTSTPTRKRDFLNPTEYVDLVRESAANVGLTAFAETRLQRYAAGNTNVLAYGTDWQEEVFQSAPFHQIDLSANGGSDKTKFYVSGGYSDQKGILVGNQFKRITTRTNLDHKASDFFSLGLNYSLSRTENKRLAADNAFSNPMQIVALSPITPLIDPRTNQISGALDNATGLPNTNFPVYYNPLLNTIGASYLATVYRNLGNIYGQLNFTKQLSFRSELGVDLLSQEEDSYYGRLTARNTSFADNGNGTNRTVTNGRFITNNFATFRPVLGEQHSLELVGGFSFEKRRVKSNSVSGQQFPSDAYKQIASAALISAGSSSRTESSLVSWFGRANYIFSNRYLINASFRADGSSRFGSNNQFGFFPAASVGWVLTEEAFLKDNAVISLIKPRVSYGITGNQSFPDFPWQALYSDAGYGGVPGQAPVQIANPDLKWETTSQLDVGLDFGFFNSRLTGEIDLYRKNTSDLALNVNVPGTSGFAQQFRNVGDLENKGLEVALNTRNLEGTNFTWSTSINASANRNKVKNLQGQIIEGGFLNRAQEGQPLGVFFGVEYAGVDPANGDALYYLNTTNADGSLDRSTTADYNAAQRVILGNPNPKWIGGVTNTFTFRNLIDFSFTFQGVFGNEVYDGGGKFMSVGFNNGFDNQTRDQLRRWRNPGDVTDVPQARLFAGNGVGESSRFLYDASYVRLRTVTLGVNIPKSLTSYARINNARLFFSGVNLLTFTDYKGWDPEVNTDYIASNISQGNDFYSAPQAKTFTVGLNIGF
ncbi:SusC/RagA family TonB-linked outer membrane protein [Hymenobacter pini]|uniref:SusC/RagA family TonB-linked outer membrane protein n=1 Tax=Hymenobacter pini TaxID=2880879 RepID=UPI001CF34794|nr:TonB-dependent receptor [Hymenobacter pini]MCA8831308.1 TonB-dependent receptor [Hymenobacter pini]